MFRALAHSALAVLVVVGAACSDSSDISSPTPTDPHVTLALGAQHACYATENATMCWGKGSDGQLGIGATPLQSAPTTVGGAPTLVSLVAGAVHTCGLDSQGSAYCWGSNRDGQLGTTAELEACPLPCAITPRPVTGGLRSRPSPPALTTRAVLPRTVVCSAGA